MAKFLLITNTDDGTGSYARLKTMGIALVNYGHEVIWLAPGLVDHPIGFQLIRFDLSKRHGVREALRNAREQVVDVDLCICTSELDAWKLLLISELAGARKMFFQRMDTVSVYKFHSQHSPRWISRIRWMVKLVLYPFLCRYIATRMDLIVFQTPGLKDNYAKHTRFDENKVEILPNNCDVNWEGEIIDNVICPWDTKGPPVVVVISNMNYWSKGIDLILEAFNSISKNIPARLALVGKLPSEYESRILRHVALSPRSDDILVLGHIPRAAKILSFATIFCAPSRVEACPNSVLEAMSISLPILASDIYAHRFLLHEDELLFDRFDPTKLADKLSILLNSRAMREANQEIVRRQADKFNFDWDKKFVEICENIISSS